MTVSALPDYKFSLLHEKGKRVDSMYIRKSDFLKEDYFFYVHAALSSFHIVYINRSTCRTFFSQIIAFNHIL